MENTGSSIEQASQKTVWTGEQKAGWFFVGMLGGIVGILVASLANVNHPDRSTATKMAALGMATWLLLFILLFFVTGCMIATLITYIPDYAYY